jgi:diguanylate cyclase (GGDEF)-like protein
MKIPSETAQRKEHARRLRHATHFDELTGLPSRNLLEDRLKKAIAQSKRWGQLLAVARLRLEGLEAIRDHDGRLVSDRVLVALAHAMKRSLSKGDTLACFEEDKFAALLPGLENELSSQSALNRLLEAAAEPIRTEDTTFQLSASIGVTFYPQEGDADADQLLHRPAWPCIEPKHLGKTVFTSLTPRRM